MQDLISVIIPVYNVCEYLQTCIDSVRNQKYNNLQIILIDDGSTDGSGGKCDEAAKADKRITAIHQSNRGLSAARNKGLEMATGKYVCFLDSDDWFNENFVFELYNLAVSRNADIAACGFKRVSSEEEVKEDNESDTPEEVTEFDNKQAVREVIEERKIKSLAWNKLYKRQLWKDIGFPKGKLHEDEYTTYKLLWKASKVVETNRELYYYRKREGSVTESLDDMFRRRRAYELIYAQKERYEFFAAREKTLEGIAFTRYMDCLKYVIRSNMITEYEDKKSVIKMYDRYAGIIWKVPNISIYKRLALTGWIFIIRLL